ncbi:MAG: glycosyltransferase family 4 protein [Methylovulum sp.]|nr:glycosyltransferase family 4 protein [Methylovulum sp.]
MMHNTRLLYLLHSGNLYGTERMALATLQGLQNELLPLLFAPPGPVHQEAGRLGIESHVFNSSKDLLRQLPHWLANAPSIAVCATGVSHSLIFLFLNLWYRVTNVHLHLVHGGTDERLSYGRKKWLNYLPVTLVAVSGFVRERLLAHGVRDQQIKVLENFLPDGQINAALQRPRFNQDGIRKVIIVSRVDPIKRLDILLDALDLEPRLAELEFRILGTGWDLDTLSARAKGRHPNVTFVGFSGQVAEALAASDMLLHCCPSEPFGLAILEAMAAKIPVLLPDAGGAGSLIPPSDLDDEAAAGLHFLANNPHDLARQLIRLQTASTAQLNRMADNAHQRLWQHYSSHARLQDYRTQFAKVMP